jgi:hypothetical protein
MRRTSRLLGPGFGVAILAAGAASATTITFDDIPVGSGTYVSIGAPYQGFNWSNVYVENNLYSDGYDNGIVSEPNAGFNGYGAVASFSAVSGTFVFNSGYFTSAFSPEEIIVSDNLGDSKVFLINDSTPTLESFGWAGVSTVYLDAVSDGEGTQFVFDDLTVNGSAVPEPATWAMMLVGFGALGATLRGAKRKLSMT